MSKAGEEETTGSLGLLAARAEEFSARIERPIGKELFATISLQRADGRVSDYRLSISSRAGEIKVCERPPCRLPVDCPERHINDDGSFCINWARVEPIVVMDEDSAGAFWGHLIQYLRLQERAEKKRRWPSKRAWAHGVAAIYQKEAEDCAKALGPDFSKALARGSLAVSRTRRGSSQFLRLMKDNKRLYSVWEKEKRIATKRQRCICGQSRLAVCDCDDHARLAADLVFALLEWQRAEERFWAVNMDAPCCGTIDGCPRASMKKNQKTELKSAA